MPSTDTGEQPSTPGTRRGLIRVLLDRFGHLIQELGKFGAVGGVAFAVDFVLFNYLKASHDWETLSAKTVATAVAATVAFVGNRF